jgi:catechol 2,3-dioxygenase-like lactoylglutathione lyase family enzyme
VSPSKVANIKAFLPAKDFARSKQFYLDLGFREVWDSGD